MSPTGRTGWTARHRGVNRRTLVIAIVLLALVARLAVVFATPHWTPRTDSANYDSVAVSLVQHGTFGNSETSLTGIADGPTAFRAPLYPVALAAVYAVVGTDSPHNRWEAGRIEEAVFGAVAVGLIILIAGRLWPGRPRIALLGGLIAALDPPLVLAGSSLMTESLFIPLSLAAVYCGLRARTPSSPRVGVAWGLAAGGLVAGSALTRTTGLVLIAPLALMVWSPARPGQARHARGRHRRRLAVPAVMVAAFLLALVPWTVRNYTVFHTFVPLSTEAGYALAGIYNSAVQHAHPYPALWQPAVADFTAVHAAHPHDDEAQYSSALDTVVAHYVVAHPFSVLRTSFWSLLRMLNLDGVQLERIAARGDAYPVWLSVLSVYAFWLLALAAIAGACTRAARRPGIWFWGCALAMFLVALPVIGTTRYRVPVDPWVVLLAAVALDRGLERLRPYGSSDGASADAGPAPEALASAAG